MYIRRNQNTVWLITTQQAREWWLGTKCGRYLNWVPACPWNTEQMDSPLFINNPEGWAAWFTLRRGHHSFLSIIPAFSDITHPAWARISTIQEVYVLLTPILRVSVYISSYGGNSGPETQCASWFLPQGFTQGWWRWNGQTTVCPKAVFVNSRWLQEVRWCEPLDRKGGGVKAGTGDCEVPVSPA